MARRIALLVVTLVTVLLGAVAVPLGLITASQDRQDFTDGTVTTARTVANVTEERLDSGPAGPRLARSLADIQRDGDLVTVYDAVGRRLAGTVMIPGVQPGLVSRALAGASTFTYQLDDRLLVVTPVRQDSARGSVGVVALARSTEPLEHRTAALWSWLALVSAAGLLAAALIATALSRWLGRPLGALAEAAQQLGDGHFRARAPAAAGPREVRRLASNFNQMAGRLEALIDGHQAMLADVSHQLRTPLAALRLRFDVLAQETRASEGAHIAEELAGAQEEVARLSRMVDGLLAVVRAEKVPSSAVQVPVQTVLADRAAAWRPAAEEKSVSLSLSAADPLIARLRYDDLEQILDNLLANALEAVPAGGRIQLAAAQAGDRVRIAVVDDGPGMSPQQRETAFRRYVTSRPGGTGLGLAIVHRLVTSSGGTAELAETAGGGLTVTLELPVGQRVRPAR